MARKPIPDSGTLAVDAGAWLDELVRLGSKNDAGHSCRELSAIWGVSEKIVQRRLQQAADLGRLVVGRRSRPRIDGIRTVTSVYTIVPAGPKR